MINIEDKIIEIDNLNNKNINEKKLSLENLLHEYNDKKIKMKKSIIIFNSLYY